MAAFAVAIMVLGLMAGTAQAQTSPCDEPTASCTVATNVNATNCSGGGALAWFCDFGDVAVPVVVGGDCFFGFPVPYPDIILGSNYDDVIDAGEESDVVCGGPGNDVIDGGPGDEELFGQQGNDVVDGNSGNDSITGNAGNDALLGGDGFDSLNGGAGTDRCIGGEGTDAVSCEYIARAGTAGL
jgi:hypothetical protein